MSGTTNPSKLDGVEETVKDFWASRPRRPRQGRKLAGVAAAVGSRYGIDPVVVRVALVAMTVFGGIGLSVYLLGWLLFPGEDDEVSAFESLIGRGRSSVSAPVALVLCVALLPVTGWAFSANWFDGGGLFGLALVVTALYLLHHSRGHLNRPTPVEPWAAGSTVTDSREGTMSGTGVSTSTAPQEWDPLGAAPLAWSLPDPPAPPEPVEPPTPRRKSMVGLAAFGTALAVGGAGAALATEGVPWFTAAHVIGLVLAVVGVGLVLGGFLGGGRGLVWLALPLSLAGIVLTSVPIPAVGGGLGTLEATPRSAAEVLPVYQRTAGEITLDLRQLPPSRPVDTTVRAGAGNVTVIVPPDADVTYACTATLGNVDCFGREQSGVGTPTLDGHDVGADGPGGQRIALDVTAGAGNVEVRRG